MACIFKSIRYPHAIRILAACILLVCSAAEVWGTDYTWNGGGGADTRWTNVSNWGGSGYPGQDSSDTATFTGSSAASVTVDTAVSIGGLNFNTLGASTITLTFSTYNLTVTSTLAFFGNSSGTEYSSNVTLIGNGISPDETSGGSGQLILEGGFDDAQEKDNTLTFENYASIYITGGTFYIDHSSGQLKLVSSDKTGLLHIGSGVSSYSASDSVNNDGVTVIVDGYSVATSVSGTTMTVTVSASSSIPVLKYTAARTGSGSFTLTGSQITGSPVTITDVSSAVDLTSSSYSSPAEVSFTITPGGTTPADGDTLTLKLYLNDGFSLIGTVTYTYSSTGYYVWTGGTTAWETDSNWSPATGYPNSTSALVYIPDTTNKPEISSDITVKSITIQSGAALTVSSGTLTGTTVEIENGGTLRVDSGATADITNVTVDSGGSLIVNGILDVTSLTLASGCTTNYGSSSLVDFTGLSSSWTCGSPKNNPFLNIKIDGTLTPSSDMYVSGTWTNSGTYTDASHKVTFTGSSASIASGGTSFYNLAVNSSGTVTASTAVAAAGNLTVTAGTLACTDTLTVSNNLSVAGGSLETDGNLSVTGALSVSSGSLTMNGGSGPQSTSAGTCSFTGGTINFGNSAADSFTAGSGGISFPAALTALSGAGNITATGSTISLGKNVTLNGALTFKSAVSLTADVSFVTGTSAYGLEFDDNVSCITYTLETTGTGETTIASSVTLSATTGTMTFGGNVINGGTITGGTGKITFSGDVTNNGTINVPNAGTGSTGVEFDGTYSDGTSGTLVGNTTSNPYLDFKASSVAFRDGGFTANGDIVRFNGTDAQTFTPGSNTFAGVVIDNSAGVSSGVLSCSDFIQISGNTTFSGSLTCSGDITIVDGTLTLGGATSAVSVTIDSDSDNDGKLDSNSNTITLSGNWTNNNASGGFTAQNSTVEFTANATITGNNTFYNFTCTTAGKTLTFEGGKTQTIASGGKFIITGTSGNEITLTSTVTDGSSNWILSATAVPDQVDVSYATVSYADATDVIISDVTNSSEGTVGTTMNWFNADYYWIGGTDTSWETISNWKIGSASGSTPSAVPPKDNSSVTVTISDSSSTVLTLAAPITAMKKITVDASQTVDFAGQNVTATDITNNGTVKLAGTQTLTFTNAPVNGTASTIEYTYTGNAAPLWHKTGTPTDSYHNLTVDNGCILQLGAQTVAIDTANSGVLSNSGTVEINGTGSINTSDSSNGTFIYSAAVGGTLSALNGYYDLTVSSSPWIVDGDSTVNHNLTLDTVDVMLNQKTAGTVQTLTLNGAVSGTYTLTANNVNVNMSSATSITDTSFVFTGDENQSFTPNVLLTYPSITVNKTGGTLTVPTNALMTAALSVSGGNCTFEKLITVTNTSLTDLTTAGTVTFGAGGSFAGGVTHMAGPTDTAGTLTAAGKNITLAAVDLTGTSEITTGTSAGSVTIGGSVSDSGTTSDLTITSPSIALDGGSVTTGGSQSYTGTVTSSAASGLTLSANSGSGTITLDSASVSTSGTTGKNQTYTGNVVVKRNTSFTAGTDTVTFGGTLDAIGSPDYTITVGDGSTATNAVFGGNVSNTGDITCYGDASFDGNLTTAGALAVSGNAVFGDDSTDSMTGISSVSVTGATTINSATITTTGTQTYTGNVTVNSTADTTLTASSFIVGTSFTGNSHKLTLAGNVTNNGTVTAGTGGLEITGAYGGTSDTLVNNSAGGITFNHSGSSDYAVTIGTYTANSGTLTFTGTGTGTVTFSPGNSTYGNIAVNKTGADAVLDFSNNDFTQGTSNSFTVTDGDVTAGTGKFVTGTLFVASAGTFTQTGANASGTVALQSVQDITGTGSVTWDSGSNGGYLTLGGCSSTGTVAFNHKNVTMTGSTSLTGVVFYDLYIPDGVTVTNGGTITVIRNFTLSDADSDSDNGTYTPGSGILYLGGMASSGVASAPGTVTDNSTAVQSLGAVVINGDSQTATKTVATAVKAASLTVTAGTLDLATDNAVLTVTGVTVNNGTITAGAGNVTFLGNYSGTNAAAGLPSFAASSGTTYFGGNADLSGTTFTANGGTVDFNGSSAQTLTLGSSDTTFNALEINTTGTSFTLADGTGMLTATTLSDAAGGTENIILYAPVSVTTLTDGTFYTTGTVTIGNDGSGTDTASFTNGITHTAGDTVLACALTTTNKPVTFGNAAGPMTVTVNKLSSITTGGTGSGTVTLNGTLVLDNNLSANSGSDGIAIGGTTNFSGDYVLTLTNTGAGNTTLSGDITTGTGGQGAVTVDSGSGTVSFSGEIGSVSAAVKSIAFTKSGGAVSFADSKTVYCGTLTTGTGAGVTFGDGSTVSLTTLAVTAGSYPVTINSTSFSVAGSSSTAFNNTGVLTLGNGTGDTFSFAGGMTDTDGGAGRQTKFTGSLKTTNSDIKLDNLVLTGTASIDTNTAAGDILITGTVTNSSAYGLTLNAGTGAVTLTGTVGSGTALLSLTITDSAALICDSAVTVSGALKQTDAATGTTTFGGAVTVGSAVLNGIDIDIQQGLTAAGAVSVTNSGTLTIADTTDPSDTGTYDLTAPGGFTQTSGGAAAAVSIAGDVSTTGTVLSFASPLTLTGNVKLYSAGAGDITCSGTINSDSTARNLTVDAGSGKASFGGSIGSTALSSISVKSTSASTDAIAFGSSCALVTTTSAQTYTGAVTFGTGTTLTAYGSGSAQLVTFGGTVTGGTHSLTLGTVSTAPTDVSFGGTVGGVTTLSVSGNAAFDGTVSSTGTVSVHGTTAVNTSAITTTGTQTYTGAATLGTETTLTAYGSSAQLVTFGGAVTGGTHSLMLGTVSTAPTDVTFGGIVGGVTTLSVSGNAAFDGTVSSTGTVSVHGTTAVNTSAITTTGTQTYTGAATLGAASSHNLTGSGITFGSSVNGTTDGSQNLTIDTGSSSGIITFTGSVGNTVPLGDVALTGAASFGSSFAQNTAHSFTLTAGSVSVLHYEFIAGAVSLISGTFTQTGYNSSDGTSSGTVYTQSVSSITTAPGTTMDWDAGDDGGSLTVSGNIAAAGTLFFHYKDLTISGILSVDGNMTLLDLIVNNGGSVTIHDGANLTVMRHVTLNSSSTFGNTGTGRLYLTNTTSSAVADKNGVIQDNNTTVQNLGDVVIAQGTTTKTFSTAITADTITMSDTTASAGAVTFDGLLTATTLTNGAPGTVPSFAIAFDGGTAVTDAVTFYTTGTVTIGNDGSDLCIFTGGISHTDAVTMRTTRLGGSLRTSDESVTFDNLVLDADASVTTKSSSGSGAGIIVKGTVTNSTPHALSLTAGTGNIQLTGAVGTPSVRLGAVTIVSAYNVAGDDTALAVPSAAAGALYAESLTQNAGSGTTRLSSADLTGDMNLTVTGTGIVVDSTITASSVVLTGGSVDLNGTVTAPSGFLSTGTTFDNTGAITTTGTDLTISHTGAVTVGAALSSGNSTAGAVTVTSSGGTVAVSGAVTSGTGTITVTGTGSSYAVSISGPLNSTTGNIDIDSASTLSITNAVSATTGTVTVDSSDSATLSSTADVTTTTGNVTFGASKTGTLSTAGNITTAGVAADATGTVTFTNAVTLTGPVSIDTTAGGSSTGSTVLFGSALDSDSTARALTIDAGIGDVTFTGAAGSTAPLASLTLIHSGALTFGNTLTVSGALTQTNAATGTTLFGGSPAAASAGSAELNGTSYTLYGTFTVTFGNMSVTNSGLFLSAENADIELTSGSFTQDGSGLNQLAGGITTSDTGSGTIAFATDVYLYGSDASMQLGGGSGAITVTDGATGYSNLHIAASTDGKMITIASPLTANNIVLYGGTLAVSNTGALTTTGDLVLLGSNYSTDDTNTDSVSGVTGLFAYNHASRTGKAASYTGGFKTVCPDGTTAIPSGTASSPFCGILTVAAGKTITVGTNFYANGIAITGSSAWTLYIPDNDKASDAFAEAYNTAVSYCTVYKTGSSTTTEYVAAAENCTATDCTGWALSRPVISAAYTVYDDVIYVSFESADGTAADIENSGGEIAAAVSSLMYDNNGTQTAFTGVFSDADCTTPLTASSGDVSSFYIKAGSTWNTDATGSSAGQGDTTAGGIHYDASTDRSGTTKNVIPYLDIPKAVSALWATLRDSRKNRITNYSTRSPTAGNSYTAVADHCAPVLIAAYTGQETHTAYSGTADSQPYYDAHNFIELRYSEPVNIGDMAAVPADGTTVENRPAEISFGSASEHGGAVSNNGSSSAEGLTVAGLASVASGYVVTGRRGSAPGDTTVSALYRQFPLTAGGADEIRPDRIRISIAGYVDGTVTADGSSYRNWTGYIDSAETPSGTVTSIANSYITDTAGIPLDDSAAASSTTNHKLTALTISNTETELYGPWDTSAPVFAPFRRSSSSAGWNEYKEPEYCEAIGNTETGNTTLDRVEFHLFDNTPAYSSSDDYVWFSRRGWCSYDTFSTLYTSYSYASDLFGGSRPFDSTAAARTSGGIRYSSVCGSMSAFKYAVGTNVTPASSFDTGKAITGGAKGTVFSTTTDTYNTTGSADSLYFAVYLSDTTLARKSTFTVSYDADAGFVTDLAGNRLKSDQINTLDLTPPEFNMTISPVGNNFLYVVFGKALNLTELLWIDDSGTHTTYSDPLSLIPKSLELVDKSTGTPSTGIAIDEDTPAVKVFENDDYTGLMFKLKNSVEPENEGNVQLTDIENVYLRIKNISTSTDPVTGISGAYISYIQDSLGNSMTLYNAHALSDYAVNVVNPQYAYNVDADSNVSDVINSFHSDGSWSVHDWNADQGNYGTLMLGKNIFIHTGLADGTDDDSGGLPANVTAYFDPDPQSNAVSVTYNSNMSQNWRVWLPGVTGDVFEALAPVNNPLTGTNFISAAGSTGDDDKTYMDFTLLSDDLASKRWKAGDQVKFLFGIMDSSATPQPVMIRHVPVFNGDSSGGTYSGNEYPLYALRLTQSLSNSDTLESAGRKIASSLDLWSFKLKSLVSQRGGVTILNNVINAGAGESTVVKVTMPSDGKLSVVVMTLDGDIVQYLQHGTTTSGDHYYTWNGTTKSGKRVARGMYFVRVFGTGIDETRKVMVVKD